MELSKLELQQILREMKIKISVNQSYDELKALLKQENHNRWLKSVSQNADGRKTTVKRVIRRKKTAEKPDTKIRHAENDRINEKPYSTHLSYDPQQEHEIKTPEQHSTRPLVFVKNKNTGENSDKIFSRTKNVFESVKKRANNCCELCTRKDSDSRLGLEPHYIVPPSSGGDHSIKNVVLLCHECLEKIKNRQNPSDIKKLKRKARARIYGSIEVVKKACLHPHKET